MAKVAGWEGVFEGAAINGNVEGVRRAIALGLPINEFLFYDKTITALHYAARETTKPAILDVLIAAGADVNARTKGDVGDGRTALMLAADRGRLDLVRTLLAAGTDLAAKDSNSMSALGIACSSGKTAAYAKVVGALLAAGAKPDAEALAFASGDNSTEIVRLLLAAGADVNAPARFGTPLHFAVNDNCEGTTRILLEAGANPNLRLPANHRTYPGQSPLDVARENKHKKLIALLEIPSSAKQKRVTRAAAVSVTNLPGAWKRLEITPSVRKSLKRGAREAKFAKLEKALGARLPADVRSSYLLHDGQKPKSDGLIPTGFADLDSPFCLLSLDDVLDQWESWKEWHDDGDFEGRSGVPDTGVRAAWWHPGWVPLAVDGAGDAVCIDLAPARGGKVGQVILFDHESDDRRRLALSWAEFLTRLADFVAEATSK